MTAIDLNKVAAIIAEVAAVEIMPRYRCLTEQDVGTKCDKTFVTVADRATEAALTEKLQAYLPGSVTVGEEECENHPEVLQRLAGAGDVWIIDPIDGTRHFVEGRPGFGVMVALTRNRETIASWIHDPLTGDTLQGEQGGGVWLQGQKMHLASLDPQTAPLGLVGARLKARIDKQGTLPLEIGQASAFDYSRLFAGPRLFADSKDARATFLFYRQTKGWDHAPGLFLHREAGGYATTFAGTPYDPLYIDRGLLVAPNVAEWKAIYDEVKPLLDMS